MPLHYTKLQEVNDLLEAVRCVFLSTISYLLIILTGCLC